ncbi:MAG: ATP-dependent RecD-like DNA helicase [Xylanivirga thermophila]|jgi:exodeoxyribonuclease V alpha subunit|uniref:SF1B family DNA helicase RecD2 n=1 Tax=Xylanivirga thermophila TaxID=2496273 RepID=UPI0039F52746
MAEISGIVQEIIYRNEENGFTVLELKDDDGGEITAVGSIPFANEGEKVLITGEWTMHPDYGPQIKILDYETVAPSTIVGMEKYLASGLIKGIGPATAKRLVEKFGLDVLEVIQFHPERLTEVDGIGPAKAESIYGSFAEQKEIREVMVFLKTYGISTTFAVKIYKMYGDMTIQVVKENPYRLAQDIQGIGFKTADRIAQSMGITFDSPYRIEAGTLYVLSQAVGYGHTYLPEEKLKEAVGNILGVDKILIENAIVSLSMRQAIFTQDIEGDRAIYLAPFYYAELGVAKRLMKMSMVEFEPVYDQIEDKLKEFQMEEGIIFAKEQKEAILESLSNGVVVITGGPGTGKTTTINCIIKLFERKGLEVALAAPTGRAAKRMTETTGHEAKTIHRLLEYGYAEGEDLFNKGEDDPLSADVVIVDEMSMVDIILMNNLLKALMPGTRLVLVGDVDQLPSVGAGNVLKDIIDSGIIKVVRLTEIFRQAQESMIIVNAHRINNGEFPYLNVREKDFFFERKHAPADILNTIKELTLNRLPRFTGFDSLKDMQILSPMRKGLIGVNNLNIELQKVLNPKSYGKKEKLYRDTIFREGDKVMQIKNNYKTEWEVTEKGRVIEKGEGVFNGDVGYILSIDEEDQTMLVIFDEGREVTYDFTQLDEIELAYAISVHKSQGSEFPVVILPLAWGPPLLMTRNLLYTAVTRARDMVVIVGRESAIENMIQNNRIAERYSGLKSQFKNIFAAPSDVALPFDGI